MAESTVILGETTVIYSSWALRQAHLSVPAILAYQQPETSFKHA